MAEITYDEFSKVELRVGTILIAEKVEGADKICRLTIDMGNNEKRTLATTLGISVDFFSSGYLDVSVLQVRLS